MILKSFVLPVCTPKEGLMIRSLLEVLHDLHSFAEATRDTTEFLMMSLASSSMNVLTALKLIEDAYIC